MARCRQGQFESLIAYMTRSVRDISQSSRQQSAQYDRMGGAMQAVIEIAEQVAGNSQQTAESAERLELIVRQLQQLVGARRPPRKLTTSGHDDGVMVGAGAGMGMNGMNGGMDGGMMMPNGAMGPNRACARFARWASPEACLQVGCRWGQTLTGVAWLALALAWGTATAATVTMVAATAAMAAMLVVTESMTATITAMVAAIQAK